MEGMRADPHNPPASVGELRAFELGLRAALPAQPERAVIMPAPINRHSPYGNGAFDNSRRILNISSVGGVPGM